MTVEKRKIKKSFLFISVICGSLAIGHYFVDERTLESWLSSPQLESAMEKLNALYEAGLKEFEELKK